MRRLLAALVTFAVILALILFWKHLFWWFEVHTGTVNESGPYYGFLSGTGSDIGEITLIGGLVVFYRSHECHNAPCHWPANHTTANGHRLCKRCIAKPNTDLDLHEIHPDHQ